MNKEIDQARIENAVIKCFRALGRIETWIMIWPMLIFSPWRVRWLYLLFKARKACSFPVAYSVKWSYWYSKIHGQKLPHESAAEFMAAMGHNGHE